MNSLNSCLLRSQRKAEEDDEEDEEVEHVSKLDVQFISLKTFYYLVRSGNILH